MAAADASAWRRRAATSGGKVTAGAASSLGPASVTASRLAQTPAVTFLATLAGVAGDVALLPHECTVSPVSTHDTRRAIRPPKPRARILQVSARRRLRLTGPARDRSQLALSL